MRRREARYARRRGWVRYLRRIDEEEKRNKIDGFISYAYFPLLSWKSYRLGCLTWYRGGFKLVPLWETCLNYNSQRLTTITQGFNPLTHAKNLPLESELKQSKHPIHLSPSPRPYPLLSTTQQSLSSTPTLPPQPLSHYLLQRLKPPPSTTSPLTHLAYSFTSKLSTLHASKN